MTASALLEHPAESIAVPVIDPASMAMPRRGGDVRVFDRRDMREVGGAGHPFAAPSDLMVTNGLIRFWVGPRGLPPYLNVSAWSGGIWRELGCLLLAEFGSSSTLVGARLLGATPERATVALSIRDKGTVTVSLQRGHRRFGIVHGSKRRPTAFANRYVSWTGTPPNSVLTNASVSTAGFGSGLLLAAAGAAIFYWPPAVTGAWDVALWWRPNAASSTLADAGLATLIDPAGTTLGVLQWIASTKQIRWSNNIVALNSAALTFASGDTLCLQMRNTPTGRTLTVKTVSGAATHTSDTNPFGPIGFLSLGQAGATISTSQYGTGQYGTASYGQGSVSGGNGSRGPVDNVMVLADALTDTEAATLAATTVSLAGLPQPESRLAWFAPFDVPPFTPGSAPANGGALVYESTVDNGSTQDFHNGLSRCLYVKKFGAVKARGLALQASSTSWKVTAAIVTANSGDDKTSLLSQDSNSSEQETTVR